MDDFLIVYCKSDQQFAHLICDWLIETGYNAKILKPCFENRRTFEATINDASQKTKRVLTIFSDEFIKYMIQEEKWKDSLTENPGREFHFVIPVLIEKLELSRLKTQKIYIDLSDLDAEKAKNPFIFALRNLINGSSESNLIQTFL